MPDPRFAVKQSSAVSSDLPYRTLLQGNLWVLTSSLLILSVVMAYYVRYQTDDGVAHLWYLLSPGLLIAGSALVIHGYRRPLKQSVSWFLASVTVALFWLILAWSVWQMWGSRDGAEKIVLIGFFCVLMGWYSRYMMLIPAMIILIGGYSWFVFSDSNPEPFNQFVSLVKFPVLIVIMMFTLRKLYSQLLVRQTQNENLIAELREMSYSDALTGLANRKGFNETLRDNLSSADRFHTPLSLMILDVDFFKQYNDHLGHPEGDACLKKLADILTSQAQRAVDTVARIGGEEFALILPGSNTRQAVQLAEMIQKALQDQCIAHPGSSVSDHVTVSIGIASGSADDEESLYRKADLALYKAKHNGRNSVSVYSLLDNE